jgi:hypothetical protein
MPPRPAVLVYNQNGSNFSATWLENDFVTSYTIFLYKDDVLDSETVVYSNNVTIDCEDNHRYYIEVTAYSDTVPNVGGPVRSINGIVSGRLFVNVISVNELLPNNYLGVAIRTPLVDNSSVSIFTNTNSNSILPKDYTNPISWSIAELNQGFSNDLNQNFAFKINTTSNEYVMNNFLPYTQILIVDNIARIRYNFNGFQLSQTPLIYFINSDTGQQFSPSGITPNTIGYTEVFLTNFPPNVFARLQFTDFYGTQYSYQTINAQR